MWERDKKIAFRLDNANHFIKNVIIPRVEMLDHPERPIAIKRIIGKAQFSHVIEANRQLRHDLVNLLNGLFRKIDPLCLITPKNEGIDKMALAASPFKNSYIFAGCNVFLSNRRNKPFVGSSLDRGNKLLVTPTVSPKIWCCLLAFKNESIFDRIIIFTLRVSHYIRLKPNALSILLRLLFVLSWALVLFWGAIKHIAKPY